jgi:hypothetical protein
MISNMKNNKSTFLVFGLLILAASLYRVWDGRPFGFAPQIAMALFAGAVIKDRRISFLFPLFSMLLSDALYQVLYMQGLTSIQGFYGGQVENYLLIAAITLIGFAMNRTKISHIILGSLAGAVVYFIASNFLVWIGGGLDINNQPYPKTMDGLIACFSAALPFFKWSVASTLIFNAVFFGCFHLYTQAANKQLRQTV